MKSESLAVVAADTIERRELVVVENRQNDKFDINIGRFFFGDGEYINLELIRSKNIVSGEYMPSRVFDMLGNTLWSFREEKENEFKGRGRLVFFKKIGEIVIYLENLKGITKIIPLMSLVSLKNIKLGDTLVNMGGRTIEELAELKKGLAKELGKKFILTKEESDALEEAWLIRKANRKAEQEEEILRKQEEYRKKKEEKRQKIEAILKRAPITVYTAEGQILGGIPVAGSEWQILPGYTKVILVKSFDEETCLPGEPIEAFIVKKIGYQREKTFVKNLVFSKKPKVEKVVPKALNKLIFKIGAKFVNILHFSQEDVRLLKEQGINKEIMIAVGNPDANGKYCVVSLNEEGGETVVGAFAPVDLREYLK